MSPRASTNAEVKSLKICVIISQSVERLSHEYMKIIKRISNISCTLKEGVGVGVGAGAGVGVVQESVKKSI